MQKNTCRKQIITFDERRDIVIPGDYEAALTFSVEHFIEAANKCIQDHGYFAVALSGGSSPKAIFQRLAQSEYNKRIDWKKVLLFWSDERSVASDHPDSNYHMAMEAGFKNLPIPKDQIFRMQAEDNIEEHALEYERLILTKIPSKKLDFVMLGMGEDGHTASLFPKTHGLHTTQRVVIANFVPQMNTWRMSLTFECINQAAYIVLYVFGKSKAKILKKVLTSPYDPDNLPVQRVGTPAHKALWIVDCDAASELQNNHK